MTTYDTIYTYFLENCKVDDIDLPDSDDRIYKFIKNAAMHYNNRLRENLVCNDKLETVNKELNDDELLILSHYLRYILLKNQLTYYTNTWQPFQKDIGLSNFSTQLKLMESSVNDQGDFIESLITHQVTDFL